MLSWILEEPSAVALVALVLQLLAAEVGWRLGARHAQEEDQRTQSGAVQAAVLGLLGLLLAFTFSMAADRFEARRLLVVAESNAIGTAYLRADALAGEEGREVEALLRRYVDTRIAWFSARGDAEAQEAVKASEVLLGELWRRVEGGARQAPESLPHAMLVESTNDVIDRHSERVAADDARVPAPILLLLEVVALAGLGTIGWCFGLCRGHHRGASTLVALLVSAILYVVVDLDEPRHGRIRVDQGSLRHLQRELAGP